MIRLKELRKEKGLYQKDLAEMLGVSTSTYSYWEQGKIEIDFKNLNRIADFFNVSIDYLLGRNRLTLSDYAPNNNFAADILVDINNTALINERTKNKLSREEIAAKIGVDLDNYTEWEEGKKLCPLYYVERLAAIFRINSNSLINPTTNKVILVAGGIIETFEYKDEEIKIIRKMLKSIKQEDDEN